MHIPELSGITVDIEGYRNIRSSHVENGISKSKWRRNPNQKRRNIWPKLRTRGPANLGTFVSLLKEITSLNVPYVEVILVLGMEKKII